MRYFTFVMLIFIYFQIIGKDDQEDKESRTEMKNQRLLIKSDSRVDTPLDYSMELDYSEDGPDNVIQNHISSESSDNVGGVPAKSAHPISSTNAISNSTVA